MKTKRLLYCLMACFAVVLCSCTKDFEDNRLQVPDADKTHVGIIGASSNVVVKEISFSSSSFQSLSVEVPEWKGKVKATLQVDPALVFDYNAAHGTDYVAFPESMCDPLSGTVIIENDWLYGEDETEELEEGEETAETKAEGENTFNTTSDELTITINPVAAELDYSKKYLLPIRISSIVANSYVGLDPNASVFYLVLVPPVAAAGTEVSMTEPEVETTISVIAASTLSESLTVSIPTAGGEFLANMELAWDLVDTYNADNGTTYPAFPESMVTVSSGAALADGTTESTSASLSFNPVQAELDLSATYLLPVRIASLNASPDFTIDAENNVTYLLISVIPIPKDMWTTTYSSWWQNEPAYSPMKVLDGDINTYWHTDASAAGTMPQWVCIDFKMDRTITGFEITNRQEAEQKAVPRQLKIETSDDYVTWTTVGTFEMPDQTNSARTMVAFDLDAPVTARYFSVQVDTNWAGAGYTYIAEINPLFEE